MQDRDINLRHFFALAEIADTGRLSAAAVRVFMSQSALTQAMHKLEGAAGIQLFERKGYGVTETEAGAVLVQRSRRAADFLARAEREIKLRQGPGANIARLHHNVTASQLRALVSVVETGGYSTAARRLDLAQPTVHRAAKYLEALVSIDLFRRTARGVEPTDVARSFARYAELMFAEIRQGFEAVRELQGNMNSRVAVGCLPLARSEFLPKAITELLDTYPDARVSLLDGPYIEQLHALRYGQIDWLIGALRQPAPAADVVEEPLFDQPLAVVARPGHRLLGSSPPSIRDLAKLEWIAPRPLAPARKFFEAFFERNNIETPSRIIECSSLVATRGLLQRSERAAVLSPLQIREDIESGQLALLVNPIPDSSRSIGLTVRDNWEPTKIQADFGNIVRRLAAEVTVGVN